MSTNEKEKKKCTIKRYINILFAHPILLSLSMSSAILYHITERNFIETIIIFVYSIWFLYHFRDIRWSDVAVFLRQLLRFLFAHPSELKTEGASKRLIKGAMAALFYVCAIVGYLISGFLIKHGIEVFNIHMLSNGMLVSEITLSLVGGFVLLVVSRSIWLAAYDIENSDAKEVMKEIGPFWLAYIGALDILARLFTSI